MVRHFAKARQLDPETFAAAYAALGAQRALRILGIFAKLCLQGTKPRYVAMMPRIWAYVQRNLTHPALADLKVVCDSVLPPPDLQKLEAQCGAFR